MRCCMQPTAAKLFPCDEKPVSFAAFAERLGMSAVMRAAFEAHVRTDTGAAGFNYRRPSEWTRLHQEFLVADRRRQAR